MKISNEKNVELSSSIDITEECIGIVIGNRDDTGKNTLKLYIPRFMMGIDIDGGKPVEKTAFIKNGIFKNTINKNIGKNTIKLQNYLEIPPFTIPGVSLPRYVLGERVTVTFADKDIKNPVYFPYQVKDDVKRKEDIMRYFVPSKADEGDPIVDENSYFLELNSVNKFVRLFTSNSNDEKCPFTFNIDTKNGITTFKDDSARYFEWNYDEDKISFGTDGGIVFEMKGADITCKCENFTMEASESMQLKTSKFKLEADQGDVVISNMYVENTSYEHKSSNSKLKYDLSECSGNLWQIISPGLFLDSPSVINTGMSVFAGFYVTKVPAPGKTPSIYSGGALDGASVGSSSNPPQSKPSSTSPSSKQSGSTSTTDMKGNFMGKPLAYADPVKTCLQTIAKVADQALGIAMFHMHPGEYFPLAMNPVTPSVPKQPSSTMQVATPACTSLIPLIAASNFKA